MLVKARVLLREWVCVFCNDLTIGYSNFFFFLNRLKSIVRSIFLQLICR